MTAAGRGTRPAATRSRRWSGDWARPGAPVAPLVDVLVPTVGRPPALAVTLAGLAAQDDPPFRVVVSDQSDDGAGPADPAVQAMVRVLRAQGRPVELLRHLPRRGLAEHRAFLLAQATAPAVLLLDDDVWLEPGSLARLHDALRTLRCGFVGSAVQGLSFLDDDRPHERVAFERWEGEVRPERVRRGTPAFERWRLHNAANLAHLAAGLEVPEDGWLPYRVAWVGACVLYDRDALLACGGFDFWDRLPEHHSGEDVAVQWRVLERFGGAGIVPSGAVHLEAPTTLPRRDVDAFDVLFVEGGATTDEGRDEGRDERRDERRDEGPDEPPEMPTGARPVDERPGTVRGDGTGRRRTSSGRPSSAVATSARGSSKPVATAHRHALASEQQSSTGRGR
ncbi:glycosyltransferase [Cellulomonas endophytica]|uniref:glycosyltransferase n=1 Tax=Cellulomonas endophytica TaxID=2494735 RepID=UPI0010106D08|nr:glycosyltransferase family A protein [Cellulomonas endophytica]